MRKMPLLKLIVLKNAVSRLCKKCIYESRTLFLCYVLQVWFTPGRCSRLSSRQSLWERTSQKRPKRLNMNGNSTNLRRYASGSKRKMGLWQSQLSKVCWRCTHLGGSGGMLPGKIFKIKLVRIALVAISTSKFNYHVIEQASHNAQESRYNNKLPLLDFNTL